MKQFSLFLTVGVFNTLLGYSVIFACMYLANLSAEVSNFLGYAVGLIASYILNRKYTFNSLQRQSREVPRFLTVFAIAYGLNFLLLLLLIYSLGVHEGISQVFAGLAYVLASFLLNKNFVFNIPKVN